MPRAMSEELIALNRDYIHSVQHGDVRRFEKSGRFPVLNPDGTLVDRPGFSRRQRAGDQRLATGVIECASAIAIIHARTSYTTATGEHRHGRYTDVWARRNGVWLAVSAHVTR